MSKPVIDLTSQQSLLTNRYIYTLQLSNPRKPSLPSVHLNSVSKTDHCNNPLATHTPKKPSPIWGNLPSFN